MKLTNCDFAMVIGYESNRSIVSSSNNNILCSLCATTFKSRKFGKIWKNKLQLDNLIPITCTYIDDTVSSWKETMYFHLLKPDDHLNHLPISHRVNSVKKTIHLLPICLYICEYFSTITLNFRSCGRAIMLGYFV